MAYDESKDKLIKQFTKTYEDKSEFIISVMQYDGGTPRVRFSKMFVKRDETIGYGKPKFDKEQMEFLKEHMDEILEVM